jgi:hypothetical protein
LQAKSLLEKTHKEPMVPTWAQKASATHLLTMLRFHNSKSSLKLIQKVFSESTTFHWANQILLLTHLRISSRVSMMNNSNLEDHQQEDPNYSMTTP